MAEDFVRWLDELKSRAGIGDIASEYVKLERRGSKLWACCPFHHEKTPSFTLDEENNLFYCFGCHEGGDVLTFVSKIENTDFMGAVRILADKLRMPMPQFGLADEGSRRRLERLRGMMKLAGQFYHENLMDENGAKARAYLSGRGIELSTIKIFGLGFSPGYRQLVSFLSAKGYTAQEMGEAGLTDVREGKALDAMAGRIVVPIINNLKQIVAFGGRVTEKDRLPKYKNTRETVLFNKSRELFGQHSIKKLMLEEPLTNVIMVEGYMDVISLYQAGVRNAMASMGTALTDDQAKLLSRYTKKVVICYDGDSAGQKATQRGLEILHRAELDVKVMSLPDGKDPDEYVREFGKEGFLEQVMRAKPLYEYKLDKLTESFEMTTADGKGKYAVAAMKILKELGNIAQIEAYLPLVTARSGVSRDTLLRQLDQTPGEAKIVAARKKLPATAYDRALRYLLYGLFFGTVEANAADDLSTYIVSPDQQKLYDLWRAGQLDEESLLSYDESNPEVREILEEGSKISDELAATYFADCLKRVKTDTRKQQLAAISRALDGETDEQTKKLLQTRLIQLTKTSGKGNQNG